jgi:hypothetical protein
VPLDRKGDDSEIALSLMVEPAYASSTALEISPGSGIGGWPALDLIYVNIYFH